MTNLRIKTVDRGAKKKMPFIKAEQREET